ncbi:MAG: AAA family ATPase [Coleofasciculus sp. G3-WIS-01]|uniref:AAA family ATPase n=1 Tax=Coleofasciculus sp. G3-WIS-01 TaxID=3069528 RepID=UPI003305460D
MKVKRLKINNFRGLDDLTLDFQQTYPTVIIGVNGVGKSSILDCLAILLSLMTGWLQDYTGSVRGFSEQDITNGKNETDNEITIVYDSQDVTWKRRHQRGSQQIPITDNALEQLLLLVVPGLKERMSSFQLQKQIRPTLESIASSGGLYRVDLEGIRSQWEAMTGSDEFQNFVDTIRRNLLDEPSEFNLPLIVYYPINRQVVDIPLEVTENHELKQIDAYEQALQARQVDFKRFFEWFREREDLENEYRLQNKADFIDSQLEAVRRAISSILDNFSNLRVRRSPLRMTIQKHDEELIINQLSDGEKCLLAMVGDLARRLAIANPGLDEPLQGSGVVLIDEIELHLHPKWQRDSIPALTRTFPNCQFIVTTHSPQVISQVKPEGIYILEKTEDGIVAKQPESSYGRDSNRILEDLMDTPERPQPIKERLLELFRLIDDGKLSEARQLKNNLAQEIGSDEPEFASADMLIRRKEILG